MPSTEVRKGPARVQGRRWGSWATPSTEIRPDWQGRPGTAWKGWRPTVRGPGDEPGRSPARRAARGKEAGRAIRIPVSPWGPADEGPTRTRVNKRTTKFIIKRRDKGRPVMQMQIRTRKSAAFWGVQGGSELPPWWRPPGGAGF